MALSLIVAHNVFLTREQCYQVYNGLAIEVVGVNVPVWIHRGEISEPAAEVFCKYYIQCGEELSINEQFRTFDVSIPKNRGDSEEYVTTLVSAKDLLDLKDGGIESLVFRQMHIKRHGNNSINTIHYLEIKRMEDLLETLS